MRARVPCNVARNALAFLVFAFLLWFRFSDGLGSMATVTASFDGSATVCGVLSGQKRGIRCVQGNNKGIDVFPNVSFLGISGGDGFFCGIRQGGLPLLCWSIESSGNPTSFNSKRISKNVVLREIAVGKSHICGVTNATGEAVCWRGSSAPIGDGNLSFVGISAGNNFTCGVMQNGAGHCWGLNGTEVFTQETQHWTVEVAGDGHVCGVGRNGFVKCFGRNDSGQAAVPKQRPFEFNVLALGKRHTCALRTLNKTVECWGCPGSIAGAPVNESFEVIVAGDSYTCGILTGNFSVYCWGGRGFEQGKIVALPPVLPGLCTTATCSCGIYPNSDSLCGGQEFRICAPCEAQGASPAPTVVEIEKESKSPKRELLIFAIVGSVGAGIGLVTVVWFLWRQFSRAGRVHNSVQPQLGHASSLRRQSSRPMRRQRSGPSSAKRGAEEFSRAELEAATDGFSEKNRIGAGSYGTVYKGKLPDGREVAIKRGASLESKNAKKKLQEKEAAFHTELGFMSRLHHRNLVSLVGFCDEAEERTLVYEYMRNGSLYEHLHYLPVETSLVSSWASRIKIALDAARGIEYLHTYADPPIIHRDIKTSNILLDASGAARVSDFGLSLMGPPDSENGHLSMKAAGTVGYMDPEYYRLQHLTTKSDVYGFGVVLLELLTGRKAVFRHSDSSGPVSVVDYGVPRIMSDELHRVLDSRIMPPGPREIEAVELVAYIAVMCVSLEGKDRPSMTDVVANLERAMGICAVQQESVSRNGSAASRGSRNGSAASRSRSGSSAVSFEEAQ